MDYVISQMLIIVLTVIISFGLYLLIRKMRNHYEAYTKNSSSRRTRHSKRQHRHYRRRQGYLRNFDLGTS